MQLNDFHDFGTIGDFEPISQSALWRMSKNFWGKQGSKAFFSGEVPFAVTNDSPHVSDAVDVFVQSCRDSEPLTDTLDQISVLELGAGSGLFAKLFLDELAKACQKSGECYYDKIKYVVTDGSAQMVEDMRSNSVLGQHETKVEYATVLLPGMDRIGELAPNGFYAIHVNYLLDSLPFSILALHADRIWELFAKGRVHSSILNEIGLPQLLAFSELDDLSESQTRKFYESLVLETKYIPVHRESVQFLDTIPPHVEAPQQFLHCHGALSVISEAKEYLSENGYLLATDYGYTNEDEAPDSYEPQGFGRSAAVGVNFSQIHSFVTQIPGWQVVSPPKDPESLRTRMIGRGFSAGSVQLFKQRFGESASRERQKPFDDAVAATELGRFEVARSKYLKYLNENTNSWSAHERVAAFLSYTMNEHLLGIEIAKRGLEFNQYCSGLWNVLGDCHFARDEFEEAEICYENASEVDVSDARSRMNMAYVEHRAGRYASALNRIGEAFALDMEGNFRDVLLEKQASIIDDLVHSHARRVLRNANRIRYSDLPNVS